jgi:hypothetical protein
MSVVCRNAATMLLLEILVLRELLALLGVKHRILTKRQPKTVLQEKDKLHRFIHWTPRPYTFISWTTVRLQ